MTTTLETVLIGLAVIGLVAYRLSRWQSVDLGSQLRLPAILVIGAAISLAASAHRSGNFVHLSVLDVLILTAELIVGVLVGALLGGLTEIRSFADGTKSRLGRVGIVIFLGFIAARIGIGVLAGMLGASLAAMPAAALLVLAALKTVQVLIVRRRLAERRSAERQQTYAASQR